MGTYTTNYNLFMPTVGETGWGELVNGNFTTIDTTMKSLSNRITTCESYGARITAVENEVNGALSCTSVTASGKITGNGGIAGTTGTFSGAVSCTKLTETNPGVWTVTPTNTYLDNNTGFRTMYVGKWVQLLPFSYKKYSGSIKFYSTYGGATIVCAVNINDATNPEITTVQGMNTFSFNNADCLIIYGGVNAQYVKLCNFTIS